MKSIIVMQSDFTIDTPAVSSMYGVCKIVDPELEIYDNSHAIPSFDTYQASDFLASVVEFWPEGTVFVSVVDPTVGTGRRASVAKLKNGSFVVSPDNGSLTHLKKYFGIEEIREIDDVKNRLQSTKDVSIFHGRDLFSYCAAKLASGKISFEEVGKEYPVDEIILHEIVEPWVEDGKISGMISNLDTHFGLVASNIPIGLLKEEGISIDDKLNVIITNAGKLVYEDKVSFKPSFGYVGVGQAVIVTSEMATVQIAINQGNFIEEYKIDCGPDWIISVGKTFNRLIEN